MHQYSYSNPGSYEAEVFSIEDFDPPDWSTYGMGNFRQLRASDVDTVRVALVVRDPFNWLASSKKVSVPADPTGHEISARRNEIWKRQVRECLGYTDFLPCFRPISFNRWFVDRRYRADLAAWFGVPFTDAGINEVSHYGHGSSWTKRRLDGQAQRMPVLDRWREFADASWFRDALDDEMIDLSKKFFHFYPYADKPW
jgi:hypothetical protein